MLNSFELHRVKERVTQHKGDKLENSWAG